MPAPTPSRSTWRSSPAGCGVRPPGAGAGGTIDHRDACRQRRRGTVRARMYVRTVVGAVVVERLADIPSGPALSTALAAIDVAEVGPEQIVDVLRAQSRRSAHEQARFWVSLVEVGLRRPPDDDAYWGTDPVLRAELLADWASGEVAAGLTWTSRAADRELDFAETVVGRCPRYSRRCGPGRSTAARRWSLPSTSIPLSASPRSRPRQSAPECCRWRRG